jgi:hypothetical protein
MGPRRPGRPGQGFLAVQIEPAPVEGEHAGRRHLVPRRSQAAQGRWGWHPRWGLEHLQGGAGCLRVDREEGIETREQLWR